MHKVLSFIVLATICLFALTSIGAGTEPITIDIPVTVRESPAMLYSSWSRCLGDDIGGFPQYCGWTVALLPTPYDTLWAFEDRDGCGLMSGSAEKRVIILEFNINDIPDTAYINDVSLILDVDSVYNSEGGPVLIAIEDMLTNTTPPSARLLDLTNMNDALGGDIGNKTYFGAKAVNATGEVSMHLNADALADINNQLSEGWFAIGVRVTQFTPETGKAFVRFTPRINQKIRVTYYTSTHITVRTDFEGGIVTIDDSIRADSPYIGEWYEDELHIIDTDSIQYPFPGIKHMWHSWSDGGNKRHEIHISPDTLIYTAFFDTMFQLIIHAPAYSTPSPVHPDSVWFNPREWARIQISPNTVFTGPLSRTRHIFRGWQGVGLGSYTGSSDTAWVQMREVIHQHAIYDTAYWLELDYAGTGTGVPAQIGEGWVFVHDSVEVITAESLLVEGAWYFFTHWSDAAGHLRDSTRARTWFVNPDMPRTIIANYLVDPELEVYPQDHMIVAPAHEFLLPALIDATIPFPTDSFRFTMTYDDDKLEFLGLINSSVIWSRLEATPGAGTISVFGDVPGSVMHIDVPDTIFYYHMRANIDATGTVDIDFSDFQYAFERAETYPGEVQIVPGEIDITVTTDYGGDSVWIDGTPFPAPYSDTWVGAEVREIGVDSLNPLGEGEMARFVGWSDGGARFHNVQPISDSTFTALFDTLLYLDVVSPFGTTEGSGWFERGEEREFSVDPEVITDGLSRDIFVRWEGTGDDSYTGTDNPATCVMMTPIVETAVWQAQHWLELEFTGTGAGVPAMTGEGWQDDSEWTAIETDATVADGAETKFFAWWSGGIIADRFSHSTEAFVTSPDTIIAIYADEPFAFELAVPETTLGVPSGSITIPVALDIPTAVVLSTISLNFYFDNTQLSYSGITVGDLAWPTLTGTNLSSGSSGQIYTYAESPSPLSVDSGEILANLHFNVRAGADGVSQVIAGDCGHDIETASPDSGWVNILGRVSVTVTTTPLLGNVTVGGVLHSASYEALWHRGEERAIGVPSPQYPSAGVRMTFDEWSDGGAIVHAVAPLTDTTFTADFDIDYRLHVISEHGITTGDGWYASGTVVPFDVSPDSVHYEGSYYLFDGWLGEGDDAYSGPLREATMTIYESCVETAQWSAFHELTLAHSGTPAIPALDGEGWFAEGVWTTIEADEFVDDGGDTYYFLYWSGDAPIADRLSHTTTVLVERPTALTAVYSLETGNSLFGPPAVTLAEPEAFIAVPVIFHGEGRTADSIGWDFDFPAGIAPNSVVPADFAWDELDISDDGFTATVFARNATEFSIADGDTLLKLILYVSATSGLHELDFHSPRFDLFGAVALDGVLRVTETISVVVRTDFGGKVLVDGVLRDSPFMAEWPAGSEHLIAVQEFQAVSPGHRKYFASWSDDGLRSHYVRPTTDTVFTANHQNRFRLEVVSLRGAVSGSGWYPEGATAHFSVTPESLIVGGDKFVFQSWAGDGAGAYSGAANPASVVMNAPIRETANWQESHYLGLDFVGTGSAVPAMTGEGWFPHGTWTEISTSPIVTDPARSLNPKIFSHWTGGTFADSTEPATTVLVNSALVATAVYSEAAIGATDSVWTSVGEVASVAVQAISGAPIDLDTLDMSITFGGGILAFDEISACGIAWDYLSATATNLGGGVIRVDIQAYRAEPFVVSDFVDLFCVNMQATSGGTAPFELNIVRVNSPEFGLLGGNRAVIVSDLVDLTLASPTADSIYLDDVTYPVGTTIPVVISSPHFAVAPEFVPEGEGSRHRWDTWEDSPERGREIRPTTDTTITALYVLQHRVTAETAHGTVSGDGWFDEGDSTFVAVAPDSIALGDSIIYIFTGWSGDYTGAANPCSILVDSPKDIIAQWDTLYRVRVESAHGTPETDGWCARGDSIVLKIRPTEVVEGSSRFVFTGWEGIGEGSYTGEEDSLWLHPLSPVTQTALWHTQHMVMVFDGGRGTITGGGWYDEGDTAWFSISPTIIDSTAGIRWVFDGWGGEGDEAYTGGDSAAFCTVNEPITQTAQWSLQYYLTVDAGAHGTAFGAGWYDAGEFAEFHIEPESVVVIDGKAWWFNGWAGIGDGAYNGADNPATCQMNSPIVQRASWELRFYVDITDNGAYGLPEFEGEGWHPKNTWQEIYAQSLVTSGSSRLSFSHWSGGTFDDEFSNNTLVHVDTSLSLIAHYSAFEVSPPETMFVDAGEVFDVPITLYNPFALTMMTMQFEVRFPHRLVDFVSLSAGPDIAWSTLTHIVLDDSTFIVYGNRSPSLVYPPVVLCVARFVSTETTAAVDTILLQNFSSDVSGANTHPGTLIISAPIEVTVQTDYTAEDARVLVDGVQQASPYEATWMAGESHSIGTFETIGYGGTRLAWRNWSDGGALFHSVAPLTDTTFTAHYETEHKLTVIALHGEPFGEGFYPEGADAEFGIANETVVSGGTEWTFAGWVGEGDGSYTGADNPATAAMNAPITETATYTRRHYLTVNGVHSATTGEGWYPHGTPAEFSVVDPFVEFAEGSRYAFTSWTGAYSGTNNPATWNVTTPNTQTAVWRTEHLVTIDSPRGTPLGEGWHTAGSTVEISVEATIDSAEGIRWRFAGWEIDGDIIADNPHSFMLTSPEEITALWQLQYRLDVVSPHGLPEGGGWFDAGELATFSVEPETVTIDGTRFVFTGWSGTGEGSYSGPENPRSITMTSPVIETANWKTQHYLTVDGGPSPATGEGWFDRGANRVFSVVDPIIDDDGVRQVFVGWTGWGAGSYTGAGNPAGCTMNAPILQSANYETHYMVDVNSDHGTVFGGGYHPAGSMVAFSVSPEEVIEPAVLYRFDSWQGIGAGSYIGADNPAVAIPAEPIEEIARWDTLYHLDLSAEGCGLADPILIATGFYLQGDVPISAQNPVYDGATRYHFRKWRGDGIADIFSSTTTIAIAEPETAIAEYGTFEVSPKDTIFCSAGATIWIPVILHENLPTVPLDSIGFDFFFDGDMLTFHGLAENPVIDWETTSAEPIARSADTGVRVRAYSLTPIAVAPPDTLIYIGLIVSDGGTYISPTMIDEAVFDIEGSGTVDGVVLRDELVTVTIRNDSYGDSVIVDGTAHPSPFVTTWLPGASHVISAKQRIPLGAGLRARFENWSDGGSRERTVVAVSETTFTANFVQQFAFTVFNSGADSPVPPVGTHWFDAGVTVHAFVENPDPLTSSYCTGYLGTGDLSPGGTADSVSFDITQPTSITWNWGAMVPLVVISEHGAPWPPVGTTWFTPGTTIDATNDSLDIFAPGMAWICASYTGTGSVGSGDGHEASFVIDEASEIEWHFDGPAYKLNLAVDGCGGGAPEVLGTEGYYTDEAEIVVSNRIESGGVAYYFDRWLSIPEGAIFADASDTATTIDMADAPRTAVARFVRGVRIDLFKSPAQDFGGFVVDGVSFDRTSHAEIWVPKCWIGTIASTPADTADGGDSLFVFTSWSDGGAIEHTIGPICENAVFTAFMKKQYRYRFAKDPDWNTFGTLTVGGTVFSGETSASATAWLDSGAVYQISASDIDNIDAGRRFRWTGWSDGGARTHNIGPVAGTDSLTATYQRQFALTVQKNPLQATGWIKFESTYYTDVSEALRWYDIGATANIEVSTPDGRADTLWTFDRWSAGGTEPVLEFSPVDTAELIIAEYLQGIVVLEFSVDTAAWRIGDVGLNETAAMDASEKMTMHNTGSHALVFGLHIANSGPWTAGYGAGANRFALKAKFNNSAIPPTTWGLTADAVLPTIRWATSEVFGSGGWHIESGTSENLWMSWSSPTSSTAYGPQQIGIVITGYISLP